MVSSPGDHFGAFVIPLGGKILQIIASDGSEEIPWEHVSMVVVTGGKGKRIQRTATWDEMCFLKNMFWDEDEVVLQFHPAKCDYINLHPNCLHLWKKIGFDQPVPPPIAVGPKLDAKPDGVSGV